MLFTGVVLAAMAVQIRSTTPTNFDRKKLTEMERIEQTRRMNEYPPFAYRLANILEARQEAVTYFKLEKNFIGVFDLALLFGGVKILLLPFFVVGIFWLIETAPLIVVIMGLPPVILLTIIGQRNLYGPVCLYPLIFLGITGGVCLGLNKLTKRGEK